MKYNLTRTAAALLTSVFFAASTSAAELSREDAELLMERCLAEREKLLAPEREEAVEWCIEKRRRSREYCESYHRTYGERRYRSNGTWQPALYMDLPDCTRALDAERYFRMNPGSRTYVEP